MLIRQLVAKLHCLILDRRSATRFDIRLPVTIIIPPEKNPNAVLLKQERLSMVGETKDLSEAGLSFFVPSIRLREHYLVSEERPLIAELELPDGTVTMKIVGVRYEQHEIHSSKPQYLVGARISDMESQEKEIYHRFLSRKGKSSKEIIQDFSSETPES